MVDALLFIAMMVSIILYVLYNGAQNRYEYEESKREREEKRRTQLEKDFIKDYEIFFNELHTK